MRKKVPELLPGNELPPEYIARAKGVALSAEAYVHRYSAETFDIDVGDDEEILENRQEIARNFLAMEVFHKKDILTKFTSKIRLDDMDLLMLVEAFCTGVRMITQDDVLEVDANIKACKKILEYVDEVINVYVQSYGDHMTDYVEKLQEAKNILTSVLEDN